MYRHRGYVNAVRRAANQVVHERLLLAEDTNRFIAEAEASDVLKNMAPSTAARR